MDVPSSGAGPAGMRYDPTASPNELVRKVSLRLPQGHSRHKQAGLGPLRAGARFVDADFVGGVDAGRAVDAVLMRQPEERHSSPPGLPSPAFLLGSRIDTSALGTANLAQEVVPRPRIKEGCTDMKTPSQIVGPVLCSPS